jgi:membrane-associated phospholipid phosphatase
MPEKAMPEKTIPEQVNTIATEARQEVETARRPWYHLSRIARILLVVYAIQLTLFALLAWWVHEYPVLSIDVAITREFQENHAPWLQITMDIVSYLGNNTLIFALLIVLAALIFWVVGLRLEAVVIIALSVVSSGLNLLLKIWVARPRPTANLVEVFQNASGASFPSGHVMSYLAFWGLLFSLGIILFVGWRWWRILLLVISALFVVLVGPSRIYLGDHWASDVLGAYIIGGVLLGLTLWIYLRLKERGILESTRWKKYPERYKGLRSFP